MSFRFLLLALASGLVFVRMDTALAGQCPVWKDAWDHSQAFQRVYKVKAGACRATDDGGAETVFTILELYRFHRTDQPGDTLTVATDASAPCGAIWTEGEETVLLADVAEDGSYRANICSKPVFTSEAYRRDNVLIALAPPKRDTRKPAPMARLTGKAIIHAPTNLQAVGETFRIRATLPQDWFEDGVAKGRLSYYDLETDRFVTVAAFDVPEKRGRAANRNGDRRVDFKTTIEIAEPRMVLLELSMAAPPEGYLPYNVSTFVDLVPGAPD